MVSNINTYQPLVSIIIPCYNHENFVQETIQSVIDQDYQNIELIIIDDGSKDHSVQKISMMISICQKRFVHFEFKHRDNKGLSSTLNEALDWCQGEYFATLASDDVLHPQKTSILVEVLNTNKKLAGIFSNVWHIDYQHHQHAPSDNLQINPKTNIQEYQFHDILLHQYNLPAPGQLIRLKYIKEIGGYPTSITLEDWYMWLALTHNYGSLARINLSLVGYRKHESNFSNNTKNMQAGRINVLRIISTQFCIKRGLLNLAYANTYLVSAIEQLPYNKQFSFSLFKKGIRYSPLYLMQLRVFKYLIHYILKGLK